MANEANETNLATAIEGHLYPPGEPLGTIKNGARSKIEVTGHTPPGRSPYVNLQLWIRTGDGVLVPHRERKLRINAGRELRELAKAVVKALEWAQQDGAGPETDRTR